MCETCNLPTASLRAQNRQLVIPLPIATRAKRRCQIRGQQNSAKFYRKRQGSTNHNENSCTRVRTRVRGNGVPLDFSRHGLRPGHNGSDAFLGIAVSSPSCQQIERNHFGAFSLVRERASRLPVGDPWLSGISHIMAPQHLDNILK